MNKLTPGSNLLWEGSRIILPEHKKAILRHRREQNRKTKPVMDEQMLEELSRAIGEAYALGKPVEIEVFGEWENRLVRGRIRRVDPYARRLKVALNAEGAPDTWEEAEWIPMDDIVRISIEEE